MVTIPEGWQFFNGKLKPSEDAATTFSICQNHEARLKIAYNELSNREITTG